MKQVLKILHIIPGLHLLQPGIYNKLSKTGTSKVRAIPKAQKAQSGKNMLRTFYEKLTKIVERTKRLQKFEYSVLGHMGALFQTSTFPLVKRKTSYITSKIGYSALISILCFLLSKTQFTSDITSKVRILLKTNYWCTHIEKT